MTDGAVRCKVVDQQDREYQPIPTPFQEGSFMLEMCPPGQGYIFPSHARAKSAIAYTFDYMTYKGIPWTSSDFIIFDLKG